MPEQHENPGILAAEEAASAEPPNAKPETRNAKPGTAPPPPQHLPFLVLVLLLLLALHALQGPVRHWVSGRYRAMAAFGRALDVCMEEYVEPRPAAELVQGAIEGMVDSLKDRHSAFLLPAAHRRLQDSEEGRYAGIGVLIGLTRDERLAINQVFDGSPAAKAGLRPGDIILWALEHDPNGLKEPTKHDFAAVKNLTRASAVLRGEAGTKVTLRIRRRARPRAIAEKLKDIKEGAAKEVKEDAAEEFDVTLVRGEVRPPLVEVELLPDVIGYLRIINDFPDEAHRKVSDGLAKLKAQGIRALILDLRGNAGGFLDEAIRIADLFIPSGVILSTSNRRPDENRVFHATPGGPGEDLPMAVLVDGASASAAEVLAGTLQDHGRAKLVGTKTYGKGAVSKRFPLGDGSGILLSTGKYVLPKGRHIEGTGLEPDLVVQPPTREEREALEPGAKPPDPQLEAAAKLLISQLAGPQKTP